MNIKCSVDSCENDTLNKKQVFCNIHYLRYKRNGCPLGKRNYVGAKAKWVVDNYKYEGKECLFFPFKTHISDMITVNGILDTAARNMCRLVYGNPPKLKPIVRHLCGNGHINCVNPTHLVWGDNSENQLDRIVHGTSNRGNRNGMSKLNQDDVLEICKRFRFGLNKQLILKLSHEFNVSKTAIYDIYSGRRWSWLTKRGEI